MLNLQIASLYADLSIRMTTFNRQLGQVQARLSSFTPPPITINANTSAATARLNLLLQQIRAVQAAAGARAGVGIGGGRGFGGGGAGSRGPGLLTGVGEGLGLGYMANPAMAAGAAIGAGIKEAVGTAIDLESKFAEVRRVAGLSADETGRLKSELMKIATVQPGVALDDLIQMADIGGRMGLAGKDLTTFASGLAMVKNSVSGMETEHLANSMARVLHVFQLGPEYIKGFGSALTAMDNATTASASDILQISSGLAGTAASIGVTLPQVIAISAAMRDVGITNAVASSSMSQIFRKMATNSADFAAAAGVDAKEFEAAYREGPMKALTLLMNRLAQTKDTIEAQELLKSLGLVGVRTGGTLLQLGQAFGKVAELTGVANGEFTTLKSLMAADDLKGETTAASLGKLSNAMTGLADATGASLLPHIKALADGLTDVVSAATQSEVALDRALQKRAPQAADSVANGVLGKFLPGLDFVQKNTGIGKLNPFRRLSDAILGPQRPEPKDAAGKPPALPVKPAFVPPKPPDPAGMHAIQGLASRLGLTVNRREEKEKGKDAGPAGSLDFSVRPGGGGLLGNGAGRLAMGLLTGNMAAKLQGLNQLSGGALSGAAAQAARAMAERPNGAASVGMMTGADFARRQQEEILSNKKDAEIADNTGQTVAALREMVALAKAGAGRVANALLGPE